MLPHGWSICKWTKGSDRRLKHLFNFVKAGFVKGGEMR